MPEVPSSILIVGSGVFGLSTAYAFTQRPEYANTKITVIDRSPFPSPDGSSIDTSRIIRADYSDPAYAAFAAEAQTTWRKTSPHDLGGEGRYIESGLVLVCNEGMNPYVKESFENVRTMCGYEGAVHELPDRSAIEKAVKTGGGSGNWGYLTQLLLCEIELTDLDQRSGWADAQASMIFLHHLASSTNRITFLIGTATSLIFSPSSSVLGVNLSPSQQLHADLTILATGAWTPSLIDLRGRATATGQTLCYLPLTSLEQASLSSMPIFFNMSDGCFIIPPRNQILKVARHAYGYSNPVTIRNPSPPSTAAYEKQITISLPRTTWDEPQQLVPSEGIAASRTALISMIPSLSTRAFTSARMCWYTDTPTGDFLITHHPSHSGLFLATGGSGHGFKFLPVIGERIVDAVGGTLETPLRERWRWRSDEEIEGLNGDCEDGSRSGQPGLVLREEMERDAKKGSKS
ncbi:FAD dependent oxidoreductase [Calycina marina]|uniref:FAD dependent oxidoreductase n=1 Tax=Calycina marina TaxID=1763456 RepID=A0A9P7YX22_9HELO|nr:FAD dependent oxidoreductase [Calycina marina]